jgi:hypothetical protein
MREAGVGSAARGDSGSAALLLLCQGGPGGRPGAARRGQAPAPPGLGRRAAERRPGMVGRDPGAAAVHRLHPARAERGVRAGRGALRAAAGRAAARPAPRPAAGADLLPVRPVGPRAGREPQPGRPARGGGAAADRHGTASGARGGGQPAAGDAPADRPVPHAGAGDRAAAAGPAAVQRPGGDPHGRHAQGRAARAGAPPRAGVGRSARLVPGPVRPAPAARFDGDWTAWASDRGTVVDDPDF